MKQIQSITGSDKTIKVEADPISGLWVIVKGTNYRGVQELSILVDPEELMAIIKAAE